MPPYRVELIYIGGQYRQSQQQRQAVNHGFRSRRCSFRSVRSFRAARFARARANGSWRVQSAALRQTFPPGLRRLVSTMFSHAQIYLYMSIVLSKAKRPVRDAIAFEKRTRLGRWGLPFRGHNYIWIQQLCTRWHPDRRFAQKGCYRLAGNTVYRTSRRGLPFRRHSYIRQSTPIDALHQRDANVKCVSYISAAAAADDHRF